MIKLKSLLTEGKGTPQLFKQIDTEFRAGAQKIITKAGVILKKHFKQTGLYIVVQKSWNPQLSGSNTFLSVTSPEALRQIYDIEGTEAQTRKILGKITGLRKDIGWSTIVQGPYFKHDVINEGYGIIKVTLPFVDEQSINKLGASHILTYRVELYC